MQQAAAAGTVGDSTQRPRGPDADLGSEPAPRRTAAENETLVIATIQRHADTLLRVARRNSLCEDDAADAYQRAMEIFVRRAGRLEAATVERWLCRVVRHEAIAVREQRRRGLGAVAVAVEPDLLEARHAASPEERVIEIEAIAQAAEALGSLKPAERQALSQQAAGRTYSQIAERSGWTQTKVNRCLVEGRRRFAARKTAIDTGEECERWRAALAALVSGKASARELSAVRPHLRNCQACQAHVRGLYRDAAHVDGVVPVALGGGGLDQVSGGRLTGWFSRIHDAVGFHVQERLTAQLITMQTAADTVSGAKVAAVAASAAALAGGGAAVVQQERAKDPKPSAARAHRTTPPAAARPAPAPRTGAAPAPVVAAVTRPAASARPAPAGGSAAPGPSTTRTASASRPPQSSAPAEFSSGHTVAPVGARTVSAGPASSATAPTRRAPAASGGEFSSGGSSTPAPAVGPSAGTEFAP